MKLAWAALAAVTMLAGAGVARAEQPTTDSVKHDTRNAAERTQTKTRNAADRTEAKTKRGAHKAKAKTKSVGKRTADGFGKGEENAGDMLHRGGERLRDKGR